MLLASESHPYNHRRPRPHDCFQSHLVKIDFLVVMRIISLVLPLSLSFLPVSALAHAVVKPSSVEVGTFQTFALGVPTEKSTATTGIRLVLPDGLDHVSPNVKTGWAITKKMSADGTHVTEIDWSAGEIPEGFRDEFAFSAKAPSTETTLTWKVYQSYADGTVVAWDADHSAPQSKNQEGKMDFSKQGPYSVTKVVNSITASATPAKGSGETKDMRKVRWLSGSALLFSILALVVSMRRRKN